MHLKASSQVRTLAADTSFEAEEVLLRAWREMPPWRKLDIAMDLNRAWEELAIIGIRQRHPDATPMEMKMRLAALRLDAATMKSAFGWDVELKGL